MNFFITGISFIFISAFIMLFLPQRLKLKFSAATIITSLAVILIPAVISLIYSFSLQLEIPAAFPIITILFVIDPITAFFIIIIVTGTALTVLYGQHYLKHYDMNDTPVVSSIFFTHMLIVAMLLVVTIQSTTAFLTAWELMSLSSCFLIIFDKKDKETIKTAIFYCVAMHIAFVCLLIAFIFLINKTDNLYFSSYQAILSNGSFSSTVIFFLLMTGFGIKAGFVPMHSWLPKAHPAAPSHISAMMSGVMIKTGIYGIIRIITLTNVSLNISALLLIISVITMLYGIANALTQRDIKKLLAYSSIENIGIIGIGISITLIAIYVNSTGAALLALCGTFLHSYNHTLFKTILFCTSGSIYQRTHTRDMEKLGGLSKLMPKVSMFFLIGAAAICALPPLNGFISEFMILLGMLQTITSDFKIVSLLIIISFAAIALTGASAVITFTKAYGIIFQGQPRSVIPEQKDQNDNGVIAPLGIAAVLCLAIGILPQFVLKILISPAAHFFKLKNFIVVNDDFAAVYIDTMKNISLLFIIFSILLFLTIFLRKFLLRNRSLEHHKTWGCGYSNGSPKLQYNGFSYISLYRRVFSGLAGIKILITKPESNFPKNGSVSAESYDKIDLYIIGKPINFIMDKIQRFQNLQTGRLQIYVLYGFVFLIASIIWAVIGE